MSKSKNKIPTTPYAPRDIIWIMKDNKPREGVIYKASVKPRFGALGEFEWEFLVWTPSPPMGLFGVAEKDCVLREENEIYATKRQLINDL